MGEAWMVTFRGMRFPRDPLIVLAAIAWGTYEVIWGGARPAVLTLVAALLATPMVLRVDETRRKIERGDVDDR